MKLKKIQSAEEKQKKEQRLKLFMAIFVTVLLGASTAAYALMETGSSESKKYGDFTFVRADNGGWQIKKTNIITSYLPQDVENITLKGNPELDDFSGTVYFNALGSIEISAANELLRVLPSEKAVLSCSPENENETFCADLPLKSCDDASSGMPVISFEQSNETSISYSNYCLTIKADNENALKAMDRIIFGLYSVI